MPAMNSFLQTPTRTYQDAPPASPKSAAAADGAFGWQDAEGEQPLDLATIPQENYIESHNKKLVKTEGLAYFSKQKKLSKVWDYGIQVLDLQDKKKYFLCRLCHEKKSTKHHLYSTNSSTTKWTKHLWDCSRIDIDGKHKGPAPPPSKDKIDNHLASTNSESTEPPVAVKPIVKPVVKPVDRFLLLLVRWIVTMQIAYAVVENSIFRDIIALLSSVFFKLLPRDTNTLRDIVMEEFRKKQRYIKNLLHQSKSNVHLSFATWTSENKRSYLAVVGHFVDQQFTIRVIPLAFRRVIGSHSGENMSQTVVSVIKDYNITDKLGYFVLDNAESNDVCIEAIIRDLQPNPSISKRHRRLRCMGHIINLAAQAFLYGEDPEGFEADVMSAATTRREQLVLNLWRKKGPVGKLHNIIKFIRNTPGRRDEFLATNAGDNVTSNDLDDLMDVSDNATRWNAACGMIERALNLRPRIDIFCSYHQRPTRRVAIDGDDGSIAKDTLATHDWDFLTEIYGILDPFRTATARLQGRAMTGSYGSAWEVLPTLYHLTAETKKHRDRYETLTNHNLGYQVVQHAHLVHSLNACINKLEKYKGLLNESPIYSAAIVMNPAFRWKWQQQKSPEDLLVKQDAVRQLWNDQYSTRPTSPPELSSSASIINSPRPSGRGLFDAAFALDDEPDMPQDAYAKYCNSYSIPKLHQDQTQDWWKVHHEDAVSRMAWDTLAIPAMSTECDRVFSSESHLITPVRTGPKDDDLVEANECLRIWYTQKIGEGGPDSEK